MKTDFLASGNHFLPFSQTAVNCCQWKQFFLQLEHIFQPILHSDYWKRVFCVLEGVFFIPSYFLLMWNITEIWGKSNFKDETYTCQWTPIFFNFFRYFLKRKPCFRIVEAYFSIAFIRPVETDFLLMEIVFFWWELFCYY